MISNFILNQGRYLFRGVRILAFHSVPDRSKFERNIKYILNHYNIISVEKLQIEAYLNKRPSLIITFDDGYSSVIENGLPVLKMYNVPAIMFVCPGIILGMKTFWWDIVSEYINYTFNEPIKRKVEEIKLKRYLKSINDVKRREIVDELNSKMRLKVKHNIADISMLKEWLDAGMILGNHTWDHPILNMCTNEEQVSQIKSSHYKLMEMFGSAPKFFAYPNGNVSDIAIDTLQELDYEFAFLFNHKIAKQSDDRFKISRLRLDADASLHRTASIVSGWHDFMFHSFKNI